MADLPRTVAEVAEVAGSMNFKIERGTTKKRRSELIGAETQSDRQLDKETPSRKEKRRKIER